MVFVDRIGSFHSIVYFWSKGLEVLFVLLYFKLMSMGIYLYLGISIDKDLNWNVHIRKQWKMRKNSLELKMNSLVKLGALNQA